MCSCWPSRACSGRPLNLFKTSFNNDVFASLPHLHFRSNIFIAATAAYTVYAAVAAIKIFDRKCKGGNEAKGSSFYIFTPYINSSSTRGEKLRLGFAVDKIQSPSKKL